MRNKWSYKENEKAIVDSEERLVMYSDDINDQVLQEVCQMWNTNQDLKVMQGHLDKSELCTIEESDYIMEQIGNYQESAEIEKMQDDQMQEHVTDIIENMAIVEVGNPGNEEVIEKPKKTRQPRQQVSTVKSSGKVDTASVVERLKEQAEKAQKQIEWITWLDESVNVQDMPEDLSKGARELLLQFTKEIEGLKGKYIVAIQQL